MNDKGIATTHFRQRVGKRFVSNSGPLLLLVVLGGTGCHIAPKYVRPDLPTAPPAAYKENQPGTPQTQSGGWKQANSQDAMVRGKWWEIFGDPELNSLEESLNIDNQNIKQSFENYMAARAAVHGTRSSLFPTVSAGPSYNVTVTSGGHPTQPLGQPTSSEARATVQPTISHLVSPGSRTSSAKSAARFEKAPMQHRSALPILQMSSSVNKRASRSITSNLEGRIRCSNSTTTPLSLIPNLFA